MGLLYEVGDIVTLKKVHPCGSRDWEILRVGADFRLKCQGCGHQIMVPRKMVEKNTKNLNITFKLLGFFVAESKFGKLNTSETGQSL